MRGDTYMLAEISGGKLYIDTLEHRTLAGALESEKRRGYRSGHLIIRYRQAKKYGKVYGVQTAYFSAIDGEPIPDRNVSGLLR